MLCATSGFIMELEVTKAHIGREHIPIDCLPEKFLWMTVNHGSKMRNLLSFAVTAFKDEQVILWTAKGPAVNKAISCAEIMKRKYKNLHQITRVCFCKGKETLKPSSKEEDAAIKPKQIPAIHIMLSKDALDSNQLGYQGPESLCSSILREKPPQDAKEGVGVIKKRKSKMSIQGRKSPGKSSNKQAKSSASPETDQGSSSDSKKRKLNPKKKKKSND